MSESPSADGDKVSALARRVGLVGFLLTSRQVVVVVVNAASTAVVARVLHVGPFGIYAAAVGTVTLLLVLCDLGFSLILSRELITADQGQGRLVRTAARAQTMVSALVTGGLVAIAVTAGLTTTRGEVMLIMAPLVALSGLGAYRLIFMVTFDVGILAKVDIVSNVVIQGAIIGAALVIRTAAAVAVVYSAGTLAALGVVAWFGSHRLDRERGSRKDVVPLIRRALPFGLNSIITSAYFTIDLILLQFLVQPRELGEYAAACKFLSIMVTLPGLLLSAALPAMASVMRSRDDRSDLTARLTHWLAVTAFPLNIGLCVFAGTAVRIAFGPSYADAVPLLRVLAGAGALGCLLNPLGMATVALALNRQQMISNVLALTFNVGGNVILVPIYGVTASAWLTLATDALAAGLLIGFILRSRISMRAILARLGKPALGSTVLAAVGVALRTDPTIGIPGAALAYILTLTLTRGWPKEFSEYAVQRWRSGRPGNVGGIL